MSSEPSFSVESKRFSNNFMYFYHCYRSGISCRSGPIFPIQTVYFSVISKEEIINYKSINLK